jgi:hypothetical protein
MTFRSASRSIAARLEEEDGVANACNEIEDVLVRG